MKVAIMAPLVTAIREPQRGGSQSFVPIWPAAWPPMITIGFPVVRSATLYILPPEPLGPFIRVAEGQPSLWRGSGRSDTC